MKAEGAIPILQVTNLSAALRYYTEVLGFVEDFRFGQYAGICMDDICLHLCAHTEHQRPAGGGAVSIFCDEVDPYCSQIKGRGALIKIAPESRAYGIRDFVTVDPDGNHLTFGCEAKSAQTIHPGVQQQ